MNYFNYLIKQDLLISSGYLQGIEAWANAESQEKKICPLLLVGSNGSGKSSLVSKWVQYYLQSQNHHSAQILCFYIGLSSMNSEYTSTLYQISSILKVIFRKDTYSIPGKLNTNEEKIGVYFENLLEIIDSKNKSLESSTKSLIIIIDGIEKHKYREDSYDWVPTKSPDSVRLIYTCNRDSNAYKYLKNKNFPQISIEYCDPQNKFALTLFYSTLYQHDNTDMIAKDIKKCGIIQNALYIKFLYYVLFGKNKDFSRVIINSIENYRTVLSVFEACLSQISTQCRNHSEIYDFFGYLSINSSGLTITELEMCIEDCFNIHDLLSFFSPIIFQSGNRFLLTNICFRNYILEKYVPNIVKKHSTTANVLSKLSPHRYSDIAYHICKSEDFIRLKNYLSQIPIFLEMHKPEHKLDLFLYWKLLEKLKFDPVSCYNKGIEHFVSLSPLSPQDLSILLVFVSVFFKDRVDYEKENFHKFEHPNLIGVHELKEIHVLDELESIENMVHENFKFPDNEIVSLENPFARENFKLSVIEELKKKKFKKKEFYEYKRWIWVQFPWCCIDMYSNFSKILDSIREEPEKHLQILNESVTKIVKNSGLVFHDIHYKSTQESQIFKRSAQSLTFKARKYLNSSSNLTLNSEITVSNPLNKTIYENSPKKALKIDKDFKSLSFNLSFQDLKPYKVLDRMQNNFLQFTKLKLSQKRSETLDLQKIYNQKVHELQQKKINFDLVCSQLENSSWIIQWQEESTARLSTLQEKLREKSKSLNKIKAEETRYHQIINACFKNPARNDDWERKLNKLIDSIKNITDFERKNLENTEKEIELIEIHCKNFESLHKEKKNSQQITVDRILDQFLMKSKITESLFLKEFQRGEIINSEYIPIDRGSKYDFEKDKKLMHKLREIKGLLVKKLEKYENAIEKLKRVEEISEPTDLSNIIIRLNQKEQLEKHQQKLEERLEKFENERKTLEIKLGYLRKKEEKYLFVNVNDRIDTLQESQKKADRKLEKFQCQVTEQDIIMSNCEGILLKIWTNLKIKEKFVFKPEYFKLIFARIAENTQNYGTNTENLMSHELKSVSQRSSFLEIDSTRISSEFNFFPK